MTGPEQIERIAREILGVPTLESRNADGLDFHEVSVWQLRKALAEAYMAGANRALKEMDTDV